MTPSHSVQAPNLADSPYLALLTPISVHAPVEQRVRFALHAAVLAPSLHNAQPWRFEVAGGTTPYVDVLLDATRAVPVLDPHHRQLVISCGAAIAALELGLRGCGLSPLVDLLPEPARPELLARVHVHEFGRADRQARASWRHLLARRSYRGRMSERRLDDRQRGVLETAAVEPARLVFLPPDRFPDLERLVLRASVLEGGTPGLAEEIRDWTRERERASDGVPARNWQRTSGQSALAPLVQRDFAQNRHVPDAVPNAPEAEPDIAVLLTPSDSPADWLAAGRALLAVEVAAQAMSIAVGYINQPTELEDARAGLTSLLGVERHAHPVPQLVLRVGYPLDPMPPAPPRRPVADVLTDRS